MYPCWDNSPDFKLDFFTLTSKTRSTGGRDAQTLNRCSQSQPTSVLPRHAVCTLLRIQYVSIHLVMIDDHYRPRLFSSIVINSCVHLTRNVRAAKGGHYLHIKLATPLVDASERREVGNRDIPHSNTLWGCLRQQIYIYFIFRRLLQPMLNPY